MTRTVLAVSSLALSAAVFTGCEEKSAPAPKAPAAKAGQPTADPHDHEHEHGGEAVELGSSESGPYRVRASRDEGEIKAGGDAPIDVWVEARPDSGVKVAAVRFWIGTADAQGSMKAKADVEDPKDPSRWHTHAEVPDPLPAGSQLWVEIESEGGEKTVVSFDLKA